MKSKYLTLIILILTAVVFARLGENSAELKNRYGAPVIDYDRGSYYFYGGFLIKVIDNDDRSVYISYQMKYADEEEKATFKNSKEYLNRLQFFKLPNKPLDGMDIEALLLIELGNGFVKVDDRSSENIDYYMNGSKIAVYSRLTHILSITDIVKYRLYMESQGY